MGDFDEKVGMEVIKDSMGLSDQELGPQEDIGEGDFDTDTSSDSSDWSDDQRSPPDRWSSSDRVPPERGRASAPREQAPVGRGDPLREQPLRFDPNATFRPDNKGNLIDARTGTVIARAGSEARIYQRVHKQAADYIKQVSGAVRSQMVAERQKLERAVDIGLGYERQIGELRSTLNQINAHQLDTSQLLEAAQYYKQAQTDPLGTLKNLLTRAAINGIDVSQLGVAQGLMDPKAIAELVRREISQGLAPVQQYTSGQQQALQEEGVRAQYLQQAERQVRDFFQRVPEAVPYTKIFHAVLSQPQFSTMTLEQIWDKLQLNLMRQAQSGQRQRTASPGNGRAPSQSLPNGRGMAPFGGDRGRPGNAGPAHPSKSYDAIIREVLANVR